MSDQHLLNLRALKQRHLDWFREKGVSPEAIMHPELILLANGVRGPDGYFECQDDGADWFAFRESYDIVYWRPKTGEIAWQFGNSFALGEEIIANPATTAFGPLSIFADPRHWLLAKRSGIFVVRWCWAFERLRDVSRVALAREVEPIYHRFMRPSLPKVSRLSFITSPSKDLA